MRTKLPIKVKLPIRVFLILGYLFVFSGTLFAQDYFDVPFGNLYIPCPDCKNCDCMDLDSSSCQYRSRHGSQVFLCRELEGLLIKKYLRDITNGKIFNASPTVLSNFNREISNKDRPKGQRAKFLKLLVSSSRGQLMALENFSFLSNEFPDVISETLMKLKPDNQLVLKARSHRPSSLKARGKLIAAAAYSDQIGGLDYIISEFVENLKEEQYSLEEQNKLMSIVASSLPSDRLRWIKKLKKLSDFVNNCSMADSIEEVRMKCPVENFIFFSLISRQYVDQYYLYKIDQLLKKDRVSSVQVVDILSLNNNISSSKPYLKNIVSAIDLFKTNLPVLDEEEVDKMNEILNSRLWSLSQKHPVIRSSIDELSFTLGVYLLKKKAFGDSLGLFSKVVNNRDLKIEEKAIVEEALESINDDEIRQKFNDLLKLSGGGSLPGFLVFFGIVLAIGGLYFSLGGTKEPVQDPTKVIGLTPEQKRQYEKDLEYFNVTSSIQEDELSQLYKKLAKTKHPDRGGSHEDFEELNTTYNRLKKFLEVARNAKEFVSVDRRT